MRICSIFVFVILLLVTESRGDVFQNSSIGRQVYTAKVWLEFFFYLTLQIWWPVHFSWIQLDISIIWYSVVGKNQHCFEEEEVESQCVPYLAPIGLQLSTMRHLFGTFNHFAEMIVECAANAVPIRCRFWKTEFEIRREWRYLWNLIWHPFRRQRCKGSGHHHGCHGNKSVGNSTSYDYCCFDSRGNIRWTCVVMATQRYIIPKKRDYFQFFRYIQNPHAIALSTINRYFDLLVGSIEILPVPLAQIFVRKGNFIPRHKWVENRQKLIEIDLMIIIDFNQSFFF